MCCSSRSVFLLRTGRVCFVSRRRKEGSKQQLSSVKSSVKGNESCPITTSQKSKFEHWNLCIDRPVWVQIKLPSGERRGAGDLKASLRCRKIVISSCQRRRGPLLEISLDCWCPRLFLLAVKKCWDVLQSDRSHICDVCHFRRISCLVYSGVATLQCEVDSLVPGFI